MFMKTTAILALAIALGPAFAAQWRLLCPTPLPEGFPSCAGQSDYIQLPNGSWMWSDRFPTCMDLPDGAGQWHSVETGEGIIIQASRLDDADNPGRYRLSVVLISPSMADGHALWLVGNTVASSVASTVQIAMENIGTAMQPESWGTLTLSMPSCDRLEIVHNFDGNAEMQPAYGRVTSYGRLPVAEGTIGCSWQLRHSPETKGGGLEGRPFSLSRRARRGESAIIKSLRWLNGISNGRVSRLQD